MPGGRQPARLPSVRSTVRRQPPARQPPLPLALEDPSERFGLLVILVLGEAVGATVTGEHAGTGRPPPPWLISVPQRRCVLRRDRALLGRPAEATWPDRCVRCIDTMSPLKLP